MGALGSLLGAPGSHWGEVLGALGDPGNADNYEDRALFASLLSLLCSFLSSLLSFLVSGTISTSFPRTWDPKNIANPCRGSSNSRFFVFLHWQAPRTQKIIQKASPGAPKAPETLPKRDPGAPKGDPRAPKERPQSVPIGPSGVQEASGRAFGRLRTSF